MSSGDGHSAIESHNGEFNEPVEELASGFANTKTVHQVLSG